MNKTTRQNVLTALTCFWVAVAFNHSAQAAPPEKDRATDKRAHKEKRQKSKPKAKAKATQAQDSNRKKSRGGVAEKRRNPAKAPRWAINPPKPVVFVDQNVPPLEIPMMEVVTMKGPGLCRNFADDRPPNFRRLWHL